MDEQIVEKKGGGMKAVAWIVIILLVIWGIYAVSHKSAKETGPIKLGVSLPLSGELAAYGDQIRPGIDLAVKEINDAGGINGRMIETIYEDDKCSADGASTFSKLVNVDHVTAIVGPLCSPAAAPGTPIAQSGKVPTIIWASAPGLTKVGDYIFRTYPSDSLQGKFAAEYAYNTLGKRNVSMIYVNNEWGQGLQETFSKRFIELGGKIVSTEAVNVDVKDLRSVVAKAKLVNPDMIYYPMFPVAGVVGLKQMKEIGFKVTILGADGFDAPESTKAPEAAGFLLTMGKFNDIEPFKAKVKEVLGKDVNTFAPVAYDSVKILAKVIKEVGTDGSKIKDALAKISYTEGVSLPTIAFDQDRDLSTGQSEIRIIKDGKTVPYVK